MRTTAKPTSTLLSSTPKVTGNLASASAFIWTVLPAVVNVPIELSIASVYRAAFELARQRVIADEAALRYARRTTMFWN